MVYLGVRVAVALYGRGCDRLIVKVGKKRRSGVSVLIESNCITFVRH